MDDDLRLAVALPPSEVISRLSEALPGKPPSVFQATRCRGLVWGMVADERFWIRYTHLMPGVLVLRGQVEPAEGGSVIRGRLVYNKWAWFSHWPLGLLAMARWAWECNKGWYGPWRPELFWWTLEHVALVVASLAVMTLFDAAMFNLKDPEAKRLTCFVTGFFQAQVSPDTLEA